jgi:predicted lipoprotein
MYRVGKKPVWQLLLLVSLTGCKESGGNGSSAVPDDGFDKESLLSSIGLNVVIPRIKQFHASAQTLANRIGDYCTALDAADAAPEAAATAQTSWRETMQDWQFLEALQFGPVAMNAYTLRNEVYSWPLVNTCGVDQEVIAAQDEGYVLTERYNRKGLAALEYLLFDDDLDHSCTDAVAATQQWNSLAAAERREQRCTYMQLVVDKVVAAGQQLVADWEPDQGNFLGSLTDGSEYGSMRQAVNAVSDSLFYLDREVKDRKLGVPAGINPDCREDSCPEDVEHPWADHSRQAMVANLQGFQAVFLGNLPDSAEDGVGFDDYLTALGAEDLANRMSQAIAATISALQAPDQSLTALATGIDPAACAASSRDDRQVEICSLYADMKAITDELKTEFIGILNLEKPKVAEADND